MFQYSWVEVLNVHRRPSNTYIPRKIGGTPVKTNINPPSSSFRDLSDKSLAPDGAKTPPPEMRPLSLGSLHCVIFADPSLWKRLEDNGTSELCNISIDSLLVYPLNFHFSDIACDHYPIWSHHYPNLCKTQDGFVAMLFLQRYASSCRRRNQSVSNTVPPSAQKDVPQKTPQKAEPKEKVERKFPVRFDVQGNPQIYVADLYPSHIQVPEEYFKSMTTDAKVKMCERQFNQLRSIMSVSANSAADKHYFALTGKHHPSLEGYNSSSSSKFGVTLNTQSGFATTCVCPSVSEQIIGLGHHYTSYASTVISDSWKPFMIGYTTFACQKLFTLARNSKKIINDIVSVVTQSLDSRSDVTSDVKSVSLARPYVMSPGEIAIGKRATFQNMVLGAMCFGEIDLIYDHGPQLVIVEEKSHTRYRNTAIKQLLKYQSVLTILRPGANVFCLYHDPTGLYSVGSYNTSIAYELPKYLRSFFVGQTKVPSLYPGIVPDPKDLEPQGSQSSAACARRRKRLQFRKKHSDNTNPHKPRYVLSDDASRELKDEEEDSHIVILNTESPNRLPVEQKCDTPRTPVASLSDTSRSCKPRVNRKRKSRNIPIDSHSITPVNMDYKVVSDDIATWTALSATPRFRRWPTQAERNLGVFEWRATDEIGEIPYTADGEFCQAAWAFNL